MDQVERVKKLREEYERALDAAESRRSAYHDAVLELYQGGIPLREIAKELGLSHQRVHQIVSSDPPRRSKLPRAAGGAAGVVLLLAAAVFGALRLAHTPPFAGPHILASAPCACAAVAARHGFVPGGADRRNKREVVARGTPIGQFSLWVAPDRVSRSAHCSWLQHRRMALGGTCWQRPNRGIPEVVPVSIVAASVGPAGPLSKQQLQSRHLLVLWGRTGLGVDRLTLVLYDGKRVSVPVRDGMFLFAFRSFWRIGHRPILLIGRDANGHVVDQRPVRLDRAATFGA